MNIKRFVDTSGLLFYPWVVPWAVFVCVFAAYFASYMRHVPRKTRRLFAIATIIFLGGALGIEVLGGWQHSRYGDDNLTYGLLVLLEESLEMVGLLVFVYALLDYLRAESYDFACCFGQSTHQSSNGNSLIEVQNHLNHGTVTSAEKGTSAT